MNFIILIIITISIKMNVETLILYRTFTIFFLVFIGTLLILGIFFIIRAYQTKLKNLIFLGLQNIIISIGLILNFVFTSNLLLQVFISIGHQC